MKLLGLIVLVLMMAILQAACTDADTANWSTVGKAGHVRCYSGNTVIYDGESTGKIQTVSNSDGWEFVDAKTNKFVRVSGACIVEN